MQNKLSSRDKLLESAATLFLEKGYDAISVNDICKHAEVSKGSFYHYFETKQVLLLTLMDNWSSKLMQSVLGDPITDNAKATDVLIELPNHFNDAFTVIPSGFPVLVDFWRQSMGDPTLWKTALEPYQYFFGFFMRIIQAGQKDGSIRSDVESKVLARMLAAVSMGYLLQAAFDQQDADWSAITSEGLKLLLEGIGG